MKAAEVGCCCHQPFPTYGNQVEATTEKHPMVIRGNGLFFQDTKCPEITGRPDLIGICAMTS